MTSMANASTLEASLARLYARQNLGMKFGLEVERELLARMGNPERQFGIIHVAGTNGKGSVCALLHSILEHAGIKAGLYTSPHLVRFNERIRVGDDEISDAELADLFELTEPHIAEMSKTRREPTFFECTTAMALKHFAAAHVQVAVLETGLGGRLDATNVVEPLVSVITRISVEHTAYLGNDLQSIAGEKCGIIKAGRPVVCGAMDDEAMGIVRKIAAERHAILVEASKAVSIKVIAGDLSGQKVSIDTGGAAYGTMRLPLSGLYQVENLATAIATIETLDGLGGVRIEEKAVKQGVSNVKWPGRLQILSDNPPVVVDGAHNPGAGQALADSLDAISRGRPVGLIVGMCDDKDVKNFLKPFLNSAVMLWAVPIRSERCLSTAIIASVAMGMGLECSETSLRQGMVDAKNWAIRNNGIVCICGSLFLVGEVLERGRSL
jgi:dihydrofolate synthase / folylpolyglutamate synthase